MNRVTDRDDPLRLIGRIAAGVAHDLNNYLTVLEVALELLRRRERDDLLWSHADEAVRRSSRLVQTLLDYARGGSPEPDAVDLTALVQRTLAVIGALIPASVVVVVDAGALPPVHGVATELEQVVLNLALNACDAMPGGGELRVVLRAEPGAVVLEIADTGAGVAVAPGAGALTPSSKPGRGAGGLGLGIVRRVAERHGATLDLSPRPGGGTRARLRLPSHPDAMR